MKKVSFNLHPEDDPRVIVPPDPASNFIPQWYRDGEKYIDKDTGLKDPVDPAKRGGGMKSCVPFLDAMISGYIQSLSKTIEITKNNGVDPIEFRYIEKDSDGGNYVSQHDYNLINERPGDIGYTIPRPFGYSKNHLAWSGKWGYQLPKGWSALVTHPLNRFDLPFTTVSGIMESDKFTSGGNVPFFIQKDFVGIIEAGTPMWQMIPIKREKWFGYVKRKVYDEKSIFWTNQARSVPYGFYRDKMWEKKHYDMEN